MKKMVMLAALLVLAVLTIGFVSAGEYNLADSNEGNFNDTPLGENDLSDGEKARQDNVLMQSDDTNAASERDSGDDMISQDPFTEDNLPTQALSSSVDDALLDGDSTSQFKHEAFIIYSPLKSGTYNVNESMDISVKRVKWIATYSNGYLINDYNYIFLEIIKDDVVEKSIKIYVNSPGVQYSNIGTTYQDTFTPTETGEYTVRVGFATPDMGKKYGYEHIDGITEINYLDNFTFNVVEKKDNPTQQAKTNKNTQTKVKKQNVKLTAPKKTFKVKSKIKKYIVTLKTSKNKVIKNVKIYLKIKGKTYTAKTNSKGKATFTVKLNKKGTFKLTATFKGNAEYNKSTKTAKIICKA